jgi:ATP-dependent protease ClpP protease subunit
MPMAAVQKLMDAETWMSAADCLAKGFCTEVPGRGETGRRG